MLLLGIFTVALKRLSLFRNQPRQLKAVALGFSLLGSFGIYFTSTRDFIATALVINNYAGMFGVLLFSALVGLSFYYFFEELTQCLRRALSFLSIGISLLFFGGILNNETWTSLGVLSIVIAGILALFCIRPGPEAPKPPEEEPPEPCRNISFSGPLATLQRMLTHLPLIIQRVINEGNRILLINHNHLSSLGRYGPPSPPVSPADWHRLYDAYRDVNDLIRNINQGLQNITDHECFPLINYTERQTLLVIQQTLAQHFGELQNYWTDFYTRFRRGDPPA